MDDDRRLLLAVSPLRDSDDPFFQQQKTFQVWKYMNENEKKNQKSKYL